MTVGIAKDQWNLMLASTLLPRRSAAYWHRDRHQDAFAADYQEEEYRLIGMATKFAGICGKEVRVHGRNRETVDQRRVLAKIHTRFE